MIEEFNLSEKIKCIANLDLESKGFVYIEDIKEFIRRLKHRIEEECIANELELFKDLDKLAGDKLVEADEK